MPGGKVRSRRTQNWQRRTTTLYYLTSQFSEIVRNKSYPKCYNNFTLPTFSWQFYTAVRHPRWRATTIPAEYPSKQSDFKSLNSRPSSQVGDLIFCFKSTHIVSWSHDPIMLVINRYKMVVVSSANFVDAYPWRHPPSRCSFLTTGLVRIFQDFYVLLQYSFQLDVCEFLKYAKNCSPFNVLII